MYETIINQFYSLVATGLDSVYPIYPADFKGEPSSVPFLKLSVVFAKAERSTYQTKSISGLVIVSIYYKSGYGQKLPAEIATVLDTYFENKLILDNFQTSLGSLQFLGPDKDDTTLSRADYSAPFVYYGE